MARLRTAVIGVGHLGKEHARILADFSDVELVGVADINFEQAQTIAKRCRTVAYRHHGPLIDAVDAATIAVPTVNHFDTASDFLRRGIPLLVEKPLADSLNAAEGLVQLATRHGAMLQVGHIERYNPAFEELRRRGLQPRFVECERLGPFSGRSTDIGVVLDLMIHDLDLLLDLVGSSVQTVEAVGWKVCGPHEDVAHARLRFVNGCIAHLSASRASATSRRSMRVWAESGYTAVDFADRSLVFRENLTPGAKPPGSPPQLVRPAAAGGDQLTRELREFVDCVRTGGQPRVRGEEACNAVALAHRVIQAIRQAKWSGRTVPWKPLSAGEAAA